MTTPTTLDVLRGARAKVAQGWTTAALARDGNSARVNEHDTTAVRWCVLGALSCSIPAKSRFADSLMHAAEVALRCANRMHPDGKLSAWNDASGRTQAEVLAALDRAIAAEEGKVAT